MVMPLAAHQCKIFGSTAQGIDGKRPSGPQEPLGNAVAVEAGAEKAVAAYPAGVEVGHFFLNFRNFLNKLTHCGGCTLAREGRYFLIVVKTLLRSVTASNSRASDPADIATPWANACIASLKPAACRHGRSRMLRLPFDSSSTLARHPRGIRQMERHRAKVVDFQNYGFTNIFCLSMGFRFLPEQTLPQNCRAAVSSVLSDPPHPGKKCQNKHERKGDGQCFFIELPPKYLIFHRVCIRQAHDFSITTICWIFNYIFLIRP
jgi:hypothetical protein